MKRGESCNKHKRPSLGAILEVIKAVDGSMSLADEERRAWRLAARRRLDRDVEQQQSEANPKKQKLIGGRGAGPSINKDKCNVEKGEPVTSGSISKLDR